MKTDLIIITEYIRHSGIEPQFISLLEENDLIQVYDLDNDRFLHCDDLPYIERYARMYYDLSINMEGIDAIHHLLDRIHDMQDEMKNLRNQLRFFQ